MKMKDCPISVSHTSIYRKHDKNVSNEQCTSKCRVESSLKKHNESVAKKIKNNWCIPVVYLGLNT